jgi:hypothetical protein
VPPPHHAQPHPQQPPEDAAAPASSQVIGSCADPDNGEKEIVKALSTIAATLMTGVAVLASQALGASPAAASAIPPKDVHAVPGQSPVDTRPAKSASAKCPSGERVLGGGAFTVGGVHAVITELQPIHTTGGDSFKVSAAADQFGIPVAWSFQVFAFCAPVTAALELEIISHTNLPTSGGTDQAGTVCPVGKSLIGAGGKIDNGNGQVDLSLFTNSSGPFAFGSAAAAKEDLDGFAGTYTVTGYSVCAKGLFGDFQQVKTQVFTSAASQRGSIPCPAEMSLTGLAGGTDAPGTHLQRLSPNRTNQPNFANFGAQSSAPPTGPWVMEMTAFCVK